jgi:predicted nucleic acid-binding protein
MSRIYVDTSAWISAYTGEADGTVVLNWIEKSHLHDLFISDWVITEYASGLSMKKRRGELTDETFEKSHQYFDALAKQLTHLPIDGIDYFKAASLCRDVHSNLRASDALHLALAMRHKCTAILSLDHVLSAQAKRQGLTLISI